MASWLTHLRIAEKIKEKIKDIDLDYLMIGIISAELVIKNEITLFSDIADIKVDIDANKLNGLINNFYSEHIQPEKLIVRSDKTRSFLWGCYFQLLIYKAWINEYDSVFKQEYKCKTEATVRDIIAVMKQETIILDFQYLKENGTYLIDKLKNINISLNYFSEIDSSNINEFKNKIIQYYSLEPLTSIINFEFYNLNIIDAFISKISDKCVHTLLY